MRPEKWVGVVAIVVGVIWITVIRFAHIHTETVFIVMAVGLVAGGAIELIVDKLTELAKEKLNSPTPRSELTDDQICYEFVRDVKRHMSSLNFNEVLTLMRHRGWQFSGAQSPFEILSKFGNETGLLSVEAGHVYLTTLAFHPDDRTLANMFISLFSQEKDRDTATMTMGGSEDLSLNEVIKELQQLTPLAIDFLRSCRSIEERVRSA